MSALTLTAACKGDPTPPPAFDYCAEQHLADDGYACTRAFADHPRVHLPADGAVVDGAEVTIYAALDPQADRPLILRDGGRAVVADAGGVIDLRREVDADRVPDGFAWPSYEFLDTVYAVTGAVDHVDVDLLGVPTSTLAIRDAVVRPVVRLAPEVLDGPLAGAWEGTLSGRVGDNRYDPDQRVAVRVELTGYRPEHQPIPHWTPGDGELGYALIAVGTIANATAAITFADGSCPPALGSLGEANPIAELGAAVEVLRVPAMHAPGDYQLVWNGGMGPILPVHPGAAIQDAARPEFLETSSYPHGTPNGMHLDHFRAVGSGGAPCTP